MKSKKILIILLTFAILISACVSTTTPTSVQVQPVKSTSQSVSAVASATVVPTTIVPSTAVPTEQEMTKVKMTIAKHTGYAPFYIADAEGYFKEFGIDLELVTFTKSAEAIALLVSGDIDVYSGAANSGLFNVINKEKNIKIVADRGHVDTESCIYHGLLVRRDLYDSGAITKSADLKGQTISSPPVGTGAYVLSTYLEQAGLTLDDVVLNEIPSEGLIDAFANKTLAAITCPEPEVTHLLKAGNAVVLVSAQDVLENFQVSVVTFNQNLLTKNPDAGIRFMAAYLKGVKQYNEGKTDRNLEILSQATGETVDFLKEVCWIPMQEDGLVNIPSLVKFQEWSVAQGQVDNVVTAEQLWDPSVSAAAFKLLNP